MTASRTFQPYGLGWASVAKAARNVPTAHDFNYSNFFFDVVVYENSPLLMAG